MSRDFNTSSRAHVTAKPCWRTGCDNSPPVCAIFAEKVIGNVEQRAQHLRTRVRYGQRRLKRLSREASLGGICLSFLKIGATGFGGGLAVIAQIRTLAVLKRDWFTEHEFAEAFALAQSLPGTNAGN